MLQGISSLTKSKLLRGQVEKQVHVIIVSELVKKKLATHVYIFPLHWQMNRQIGVALYIFFFLIHLTRKVTFALLQLSLTLTHRLVPCTNVSQGILTNLCSLSFSVFFENS